MKPRFFAFILLFLPLSPMFSQTWSQPVNISNIDTGEFTQYADLTIDKNETLHCVWAHKIDNNFSKIMYAYSKDNGVSWSVPIDVSLNNDKRLAYPHIVADTLGNLHLTYDYDANFTQTVIHYQQYNGHYWSTPQILSEDISYSRKNQLYIDNSNRIYCFWYSSYLSNPMCYRVNEGGTWSDSIYLPYSGFKDYIYLETATIDSKNNIHCIGWYINTGLPQYNYNYAYFKFDLQSNTWTFPVIISDVTYNGGADIKTDAMGNPHFAWRQNSPYTGNLYADSTMYRYKDGLNWSEPELVTADPWYQNLEIVNHAPYIIQREKYGDEWMVTFNRKNSHGVWIGETLLSSSWAEPHDLISTENELHLIINSNYNSAYSDILYMKYTIDTCMNTNNKTLNNISSINIYPNPAKSFIHISYQLNNKSRTTINVYKITGEPISEIYNAIDSPGHHVFKWNCRTGNGKRLNPGIYLLRITINNHTISRSVVIM